MGFDIVKTFVVRSSPEQVWRFLTDPEKVARCLPGAAITGRLDDKTWQGTMTVKVGPVSSSYKGKVTFEKLDPASRHAEIVAQGQDVRGRGGADLRLTSSMKQKAPDETEVTTTSHVNITGILAQMGRGMVQDVGDQMFQVFSQRVREELEASTEVARTGGNGAEPAQPDDGAAAQAEAGSVAQPQRRSQPEALDVGAMGARAAARSPIFWIALALIGGLLYLLFR